jgi:hypothetical protein
MITCGGDMNANVRVVDAVMLHPRASAFNELPIPPDFRAPKPAAFRRLIRIAR